jgi:hypothetical protein
MGDVIPLRDHAAARDILNGPTDSPWLRSAPDWDPCGECPIRGACREVRECQWGTPDDDPGPPPLQLRPAAPPPTSSRNRTRLMRRHCAATPPLLMMRHLPHRDITPATQ